MAGLVPVAWSWGVERSQFRSRWRKKGNAKGLELVDWPPLDSPLANGHLPVWIVRSRTLNGFKFADALGSSNAHGQFDFDLRVNGGELVGDELGADCGELSELIRHGGKLDR